MTSSTPTVPALALEAEAIDTLVDQAMRRIAPLWPLENFVAVNPFLGLADHDFSAAARRMARVAGARMSMPRSFYARAYREGRIDDRLLAEALAAAHRRAADDPEIRDLLPGDLDALRAGLTRGEQGDAPEARPLPTVAQAAREVTGRDWELLVREQVSAWAGSHLDQGQASWASPWQDRAPWTAWRLEAQVDRTPEIMGVKGFRNFVRGLPSDVDEATRHLLLELGVPAEGLELYLHRLLMNVSGWAGLLRYHLWQAELGGGTDTGLRELVTILLAWEAGLLHAFRADGTREAWEDLREEIARTPDVSGARAALELDLVLQDAFERGWQSEFVNRFRSAAAHRDPVPPHTPAEDGDTGRPSVQAAFCIDVRSEPFRRALEATGGDVQTLGFAGFFGFPITWEPLGQDESGARCPVLLAPAAVIREAVRHDSDGQETRRVASLRTLRRRAKQVWMSFKMGAVSCFGFVGPVGLAYARKLVTDGLGRTRPVPNPDTVGLDRGDGVRLGPALEPVRDGVRDTGLTLQERVEMAEGALRGMSLTDGFARLVVLAGHGATVVNNPHASGLDCGACGGHSGEANARVAAAVLNDPEVRTELAERGVEIPADVHFLAALHDTTTDEVALLDLQDVPESHQDDVERLRERLRMAGRAARGARASSLGIGPREDADAAVMMRSRDWSQVRPEWGLAGCAAFVAAPRERTRSLDLGGRAFLHDYDWGQDDGFGVLELIMTAPMVVASWISLQYYGSTVDNVTFGCGNKTLHNIVGSLKRRWRR
ncbi:MAG: DUF2309 domain-containing protein [Gemmatimonadota bacterium]